MALIYEKRDKIAYITINRPEAKNALDPVTLKELADAWIDFRDDPNVWVAIITGAGNDAFCSGADLSELIPLVTGGEMSEGGPFSSLSDFLQTFQTAFLKDGEIWKPIIAAINGYCVAGGTELILGMDIRIASENAIFGIFEPTRGLFPAGGSTIRLTRQIPYAKAMEILLIGDRVDAKEAYRIGLVNRVVPLPDLMSTAEKIAKRICENGPIAVRTIKEAAIRSLNLSMEEAFSEEMTYAVKVFSTRDAIEGPKAFKEKRKPKFEGR